MLVGFENGDEHTPVALLWEASGLTQLQLGVGATDGVALDSKVQAQLSALKSAISSAVVVPNDGGASLKSTIIAALSSWPGSVGSALVKAKDTP